MPCPAWSGLRDHLYCLDGKAQPGVSFGGGKGRDVWMGEKHGTGSMPMDGSCGMLARRQQVIQRSSSLCIFFPVLAYCCGETADPQGSDALSTEASCLPVHWIHTEDCDVAIADSTKGALSLLVLFVSCGNFKPAVNGVYLCVVALVPLVPVLVFYLLSVSSPRVLSTAGVLVPRTPDPLCGRPVLCCAPLPCSSLSFPPSFLSRCTGLLLPRPACCRQRCNTYVLCCVEVCSVSVLVPQDCSSAPDPPVPSPLKHRHIHNSALTTRLCLCLCLSLCLSHCLPRRSPSLPPLHATPAEGNSNNNRQKNGPEMRKWENVKIERARPARRTTHLPSVIRVNRRRGAGARLHPCTGHGGRGRALFGTTERKRKGLSLLGCV